MIVKGALVSIGQMAKMNNTTVVTLRHYDKLGLLVPRYTDEETGYRYYDINQNARLDMIEYMKELGMSLKEVKLVLDSGDSALIETMLAYKNEQIHRQISQLKLRHDAVERTIRSIERYRKFLESEGKKLGEASPLLRLEGISTEEEESMGAVQKAGRSKINDVIEYGELVREKGVTLLSASGSDAETSTALTLSGANVILFSTGVGTPYGAPVPTIKFASSRELCERKPNWIDFDASRIMKEDKDAVALSALSLIIAIASGDIRAKNEINGNMEIAYNCNDIK